MRLAPFVGHCFLLTMSTAAAPTDAAFAASKDTKPEPALSSWEKRWSESKIGWHAEDVNYFLAKHGKNITPYFRRDESNSGGSPAPEVSCSSEDDGGARILVPLCGKSVDMPYLATQDGVGEVVGIDGVRKALEEFAKENPSLAITETVSESHIQRFEGEGALLHGNFFDLDEKRAGGRFDAVWDRASLVAIQPKMRDAYVDTIGKLIKPGGTILLVTIDRREGTEEAKSKGPPFSVDEAEVRRLYEGAHWVESVTTVDDQDAFKLDPGSEKRFVQQGITSLHEICFIIKARQ